MLNKNKINNIIIFMLGGIFFGTISAIAATTISSNYVGYSSSKTTATNVKLAVDELYNFATTGNSVAGDILNGKTALVNGKKITGTMTNRGAWTSSPATGGRVTIPEGYHNGSGYIDTSSISSGEIVTKFSTTKNKGITVVTSYADIAYGAEDVTLRGTCMDKNFTPGYYGEVMAKGEFTKTSDMKTISIKIYNAASSHTPSTWKVGITDVSGNWKVTQSPATEGFPVVHTFDVSSLTNGTKYYVTIHLAPYHLENHYVTMQLDDQIVKNYKRTVFR